MTDKDRYVDETLKKQIQESYGASDEQLKARMDRIERTLTDDEIEGGKVCIGNTIEIQEVGEDEVETYAVVSKDEIEMYALLNADMADVLLSSSSPVGKALLGHAVGETVSVETPACTIDFVIKNIYKYEE